MGWGMGFWKYTLVLVVVWVLGVLGRVVLIGGEELVR